MKYEIQLTVNGEQVRVDVRPDETLLDVLRSRLKLTGTKKGCGKGDCGTCTVLLNGRAVRSCLVLAPTANGKDVLTVEGLARDGKLHPLQETFLEEGAVQCGFCTPGMLISAKALLDEVEEPTEEEIKMGLSGNLCRCTGYTKIISAVTKAAQKLKNGRRQ